MRNLVVVILMLCANTGYTRISPRELVANTLMREAGGEGEIGMRAVATVIHNRAGGDWQQFAAVIKQANQFAYILPQSHKHGEAWVNANRIACEMVSGQFQPVGGWTHFYNPRRTDPGWGYSLQAVTNIGKHRFGELP